MTISKETESLDAPSGNEYGYSQEFHMSEEDLQLLITLDDPWNARECDTFYNRQAEKTVAYWPGRGETTIE
jgi:hypothetical protein